MSTAINYARREWDWDIPNPVAQRMLKEPEGRTRWISRARFRSQYCPDSAWVFCHPDGTRIKEVKRGFRSACGRAGIEDFHIHDLRHTCAAWLVSAGVPLAEVRDLLGHTSVKMTERYAHLAQENVRAAVALLDDESRFAHVGSERARGIRDNPLI